MIIQTAAIVGLNKLVLIEIFDQTKKRNNFYFRSIQNFETLSKRFKINTFGSTEPIRLKQHTEWQQWKKPQSRITTCASACYKQTGI